MPRCTLSMTLSTCIGAGILFAQSSYSGPRPPKKDVPYLIEASRLIETEVEQAPASKKTGQAFSIPGAASTTRTPIPEPAFLFSPSQLRADEFVLRRFETKNGERELTRQSSADDDLHLTVRKLAPGLDRIEVDEMLDAGQYALVPQGESTIFCFDVY